MTWAAYGPPWAAYGPQNPSDRGICWHDMSGNVNQPARVPAGQPPVGAGYDGRPQQDSNLRSRLRRALIVTLVIWESGPTVRVQGCTWGAGVRSDT
jgi:hypothetical protein